MIARTNPRTHQEMDDGRLATNEIIVLRKANKKDLVALIEELYHVLFLILQAKKIYDRYPTHMWEMHKMIEEARILWNDVDLYRLPESFEKYRGKMHRRYRVMLGKEKAREKREAEKALKKGEEPADHQVTRTEEEEQYYGRKNTRTW